MSISRSHTVSSLAAGLVTLAAVPPASAAELPIPCVAGVCGSAAPSFVSNGAASAAQAGNTLTVTQTTASATLNWQSFNISSDGTVNFLQPDASSVALNQIWQSDPSRIFGSLNANGRIFLINQNGIVFGEGARVNVGGLVASSLKMTESAIQNGIAGAIGENKPAFTQFTEDGVALPSGAIRIEKGATIDSPSGQVLVFAPEVTNLGTLRTPDGQTILGAGQSVYLLASSDSNLRGLLIEVDGGGTVTNGDAAANATANAASTVGQIIAERGNVTLAGLAVNQQGRVSATTSTRFNGSIRLQARDTVIADGTPSVPRMRPTRGGVVTTGVNSSTEVTLDATDTSTAPDVTPQLKSSVLVTGDQVRVLENSRITATSGKIELIAQDDPLIPPDSSVASTSRVYVASGAKLDVSGASTELAMERNVIDVELRANEVRDSPEQRDGALRGEKVRVDIRRSGTRADGTAWEGTPVADVSAAIAAVPRDVKERNLAGGSVVIQSQGDALLSPGATIDVSGGAIAYRSGYIDTSRVISDGRVYDIGDADPLRTYDGIVEAYSVTDPMWGITRFYAGFPTFGTYTNGYVEGKDAGSLQILAPKFVLDSTLVGKVTVGQNQRQATQSFTSTSRLYRPVNQIPMAGQLIVGRETLGGASSRVTPDVTFAQGAVFPTLLGPEGASFNPLEDPLDIDGVTISPDVLGPSAMGSLMVYSDGRITVAKDVTLTPAGGGGKLTLVGKSVDFAARVTSPGASVSLVSESIDLQETDSAVRLASSAVIDVSGQWVNDNQLLNQNTQLAPLLTGGGSVNLQASDGILSVEQGSVIDVSAGAWRRANGTLQAGSAGSITIREAAPAAQPATAAIRLGGELRGYSLGTGGTLSISAKAVCIGAADCAGDDESVLALAPELFSSGGFSSYSIAATRGNLDVMPGTVVAPRASSFQIAAETSLVPTGTPLADILRITKLPELTRPPVNLSLRVAAARTETGDLYTSANFDSAPRLTLGENALLDMDVGASISLRTSTSMLVDGTISAPAGRITLELDPGLNVEDFIAQQAIWLGSFGRLLAPGVAQMIPNDLGLRQGSVLAGGTINVRATRGYFFADRNSVMDVSGTDAIIDIRDSLETGTTTPTRVASGGGVIDILAAEGAQLSGRLLGRAGTGDVPVAGGELRLTIDGTDRAETFDQPGTGGLISRFPGNARTILLTQELAATSVRPGASVPMTLNGIGQISANQVKEGGFSSLSLAARNLLEPSGDVARSIGTLAFSGDVSLFLPGRLTLDVARIEGASNQIGLSAGSYLAVGSTLRTNQQTHLTSANPVVSGAAGMSLTGGFVDLIGNVALSGFSNVRIESASDIRGRGVQRTGASSIDGSLTSSGNLTLRAAQVYPATLSNYLLEVAREEGTLTVEQQSGATRSPVLSAGGALTLRAGDIVNRGTLLAPFGSLTLEGTKVALAAGSLTSVSGAGLAVPFGNTQGGFDWVYELQDLRTLVFGGDEDQHPLPGRKIVLQGVSVDAQEGSVIDLAGGGDMLATEFVPGIGGTLDLLSPFVSPKAFAVVPSLGLSYAPYDQSMHTGTAVRPGDSVYIGAGSEIPAGNYTMLPARYALLPGAFLVTPVSGYQDLAPGEAVTRLDGARIVGGYRTMQGTGFRDSRASGFLVQNGTAVLKQANYTTTKASAFFANQADRLDIARPRLPADAGLLSLAATRYLGLNGALRAAAATGGRGAEVDIDTKDLVVTATGTQPGVPDGVVQISAESLMKLGAESLLLGGSREHTAEGLRVETAEDSSLTIAGDAHLQASELLLAASTDIVLESGSRLSAPASTATADAERQTLSIVGDGAFVRVASGAQVDLDRTGSAGTVGTLDIREGATIQTSGSVQLDSSASMNLEGQLAVAGASLALSAGRIVFGGEAEAGSLLLAPGKLESLGLRALELISRSSIDFAGNVSLSLADVTLKAQAFNALSPGTQVSINAMRASLAGMKGNAAASSAGSGTFELRSKDISIAGETLRLQAFDDVSLDAVNEIVAGDIDFGASGNLNLLAGTRLTGESGSSSAISAARALTIGMSRQGVQSTAPANASPVLGASMKLSGETVAQNGRVELASGVLGIASTGLTDGGVSFGAGSVTDLSGRNFQFDGVALGSDGGRLTVSSVSGGISLSAGASLNVSGASQGGDAGFIDLTAGAGAISLSGTLEGKAIEGYASGTFRADGNSIADLAGLNRTLNTGGFELERRFRVRGEGPLVFAGRGDSAIRAGNVSLIADRGIIEMSGEIDASMGNTSRVTLAARDGMVVSGSIDARSEKPGAIELSTQASGIHLTGSSRLQLSDGDLRLRLPRASVLTLVDGVTTNDQLLLGGSIVGAARTDLEGFAVYTDTDIGATDVVTTAANARYSQAQSFAANAAQIAAALGRTDDETFHVLAGIEIRSTGDLKISADWNLFNWRFSNEPGVLTLRAAGNLTFDRSLSDGFAAITGNGAFVLPTVPSDSWSYRLSAGADLTSADPLSVLAIKDLAAGKGNFSISPGIVSSNVSTPSTFRMVRTGTGRIDVAAGRNFTLGNGNNRASVLYTAGAASGGTKLNALGNREYADNGGDISIFAQGDIVGSPSNQLVTDWLWRAGRAAGQISPSATGWTVNFQRFEQGIGALGGGDVHVRAGGNVSNLSLSIPTVGRQTGTSLATNAVEIAGGGNLTLDVGGTLSGGSFYVGKGRGVIRADEIGRARVGQASLYPILALGDAQFRVVTRRDLGLEAATNPTLLRQGASQGAFQSRSFFSTYSDSSAITVQSHAGNVQLGGNTAELASSLSSILFGSGANEAADRLALQLYPPTLRASALTGNIEVGAGFALYPSRLGNLELFAERDVLFDPATSQALRIIVSDADASLFPSVTAPQAFFVGIGDVIDADATTSRLFHATRPVHSVAGANSDPIRVIARTGDVRVDAPFDTEVLLSTPKATRVIAGRDIVDFTLLGQNVSETDVTSLIAGRDFIYTTQRDAFGRIRASIREIVLAGPGRLEISAGRNVDLQTSRGIETNGNLFNPALAPAGASVSISAGMGSQGANYDAFIKKYFEEGTTYDARLLAYASGLAGRSVTSKSEALTVLRAAPRSEQATLVEETFFTEIRTSGRAAANAGNTDFRRAFAAIETLYPGSNPDIDEGEVNKYAGDVRLYFSRVYTLDGGDVSLLVPGGEINVGLATPPAAFGISKAASELGIVAQSTGSINAFGFGDFLVNESRVFAADGGNILVWSTRGDIDAGRGAKTAISAPAPTITIDDNGRTVITFPAALAGSGIQTLATSAGRKPGDVDLFAPRGVVNASDAGIVAGNLTIAATAVLGANNITVSGTSVGVPVDTGSLSLGVVNASSAGSSATSAAETSLAPTQREESRTPLADSVLSWLEVFIEGFGEDVCKAGDTECLERQRGK